MHIHRERREARPRFDSLFFSVHEDFSSFSTTRLGCERLERDCGLVVLRGFRPPWRLRARRTRTGTGRPSIRPGRMMACLTLLLIVPPVLLVRLQRRHQASAPQRTPKASPRTTTAPLVTRRLRTRQSPRAHSLVLHQLRRQPILSLLVLRIASPRTLVPVPWPTPERASAPPTTTVPRWTPAAVVLVPQPLVAPRAQLARLLRLALQQRQAVRRRHRHRHHHNTCFASMCTSHR